MTAQRKKPVTKTTKKPKEISPTQKAILKIKQEHPDLTTREIGALANCSHVNVIQCLAKYGINQQELADYKNNRADIFSGIQHKITTHLTDDTIKRMMQSHPGSAALWFNSLYNNERLERNLSTDNIHVHNDIIEHKRILRASKDTGGTGQKLKE